MPGMKYRAAIVGCGQIAGGYDEHSAGPTILTHAQAYRRHPQTELVAACDTDARRLKQFARRWQVPRTYSTLNDLLRSERPDLLSICTPTPLHFAMVKQAVRRQPSLRAILCEKPLAETARQAAELVALCRKTGVLLAVNHIRRWDPAHQQIKRWFQRSRLGRIQKAVWCYSKGLRHSGVHLADLIQYWWGDPQWTWAVDAIHDSASDPSLDAYLHFGSFGVSLLGFNAANFEIVELDVIGSQGRLRLSYPNSAVTYFRVENSPRLPGYRNLLAKRPPFRMRLDKIMYYVVDDLVKCLKAGRAPRCTGEDAVAGLELIEAIRASARRGRPTPFKRRFC